jgi:hypothetical protein
MKLKAIYLVSQSQLKRGLVVGSIRKIHDIDLIRRSAAR